MVSGVALTLRRLVDALHARGHAVRVYSPHYDLPPGAVERPEVHRSPGRPFFIAPDVQWAFPKVRDLVADMREFQPQVVHLATEFAMGYPGTSRLEGTRPCRSSRARTPTTRHTPGPTASGSSRWCDRAGCTCAGSTAMRTRCSAPRECTRRISTPAACTTPASGRAASTRRNSIREFRSDAWRARFGIGPTDSLVTFVGRIAPEKNLNILLDAWQRLAPMRGNAQLVLVGDGLLVENIRARQIPGIHMLGYLHGIELATAYASSDVFAFPVRHGDLRQRAARGDGVGHRAGVRQRRWSERLRRAWPECADGTTKRCRCICGTAGARAIGDPALRRQIGEGARQTALSRRWDAIYDQLLDDYAETIADRRQRRAAA